MPAAGPTAIPPSGSRSMRGWSRASSATACHQDHAERALVLGVPRARHRAARPRPARTGRPRWPPRTTSTWRTGSRPPPCARPRTRAGRADPQPRRGAAGHRLGQRPRRRSAVDAAGEPDLPRAGAGRRYPADLLAMTDGRDRLAFVADGDLEAIIRGPTDLLGVNYYTPTPSRRSARDGDPAERVAADPSGAAAVMWPGTDRAVVPTPGRRRRWDGRWTPTGLRDLLLRVHRDYPDLPLLITENGVAFDDEPGDDGVHDPAGSTTCASTSPPRTRRWRPVSTCGGTSSGHSGQLRVGVGIRQALRPGLRRLSDATPDPEGFGQVVPRGDRGERPAVTALSGDDRAAKHHPSGLLQGGKVHAGIGGIDDQVGRRALVEAGEPEPVPAAPGCLRDDLALRDASTDERADLVADEAVRQAAAGVSAGVEGQARFVGMPNPLPRGREQRPHVRRVAPGTFPPRRRQCPATCRR